jgi:hypothetical protein
MAHLEAFAAKRPTGMNESTRRQILGELGIEVWLLRAARPAGGQPEAGAGSASVAGAPPPRATQRTPARVRPSLPPARPVAAANARTEAVRSLTVLALACPGVLLTLTGTPSRRDLRLARDLLAAATGRWDVSPQRRAFRWPPGLPASAEGGGSNSMERALAAFIDKDIADHAVSLLLCTADVDVLLPGEWPGCRRHVIAPLEALGRDAGAKRAVWRFLCETPV